MALGPDRHNLRRVDGPVALQPPARVHHVLHLHTSKLENYGGSGGPGPGPGDPTIHKLNRYQFVTDVFKKPGT